MAALVWGFLPAPLGLGRSFPPLVRVLYIKLSRCTVVGCCRQVWNAGHQAQVLQGGDVQHWRGYWSRTGFCRRGGDAAFTLRFCIQRGCYEQARALNTGSVLHMRRNASCGSRELYTAVPRVPWMPFSTGCFCSHEKGASIFAV